METQTKWQKTSQWLKERDMVRVHLDIPQKRQYEMRLAAAQDGKKIKDVYIEAIVNYLKGRKNKKGCDSQRNADLELDLSDLE